MTDPSDEEILDALYSFLDASTPFQAAQIVQARQATLFTRRAEELLGHIVDQNKNSPLFPILAEKRDFLINCRRQGIDAAFTPYTTAEDSDIPAELLVQFGRLGSWEEFEHFMQEHPEINSMGAKFLSGRIAQVAKAKGISNPNLAHMRLMAIGLELEDLREQKDASKRISLLQEALSLVDQRSNPENWAFLKTELGKAIALNPLSNRAQNIKEATRIFQEAVIFLESEGLSGTMFWAIALFNLGNAYVDDLAEGDRKTNFAKALECYNQALTVTAYFEEAPLEWGLAQVYVAQAYIQQPIPDYRLAIQHYEKALEAYRRDDHPDKWASVMCEIGQAYMHYAENEAENIEHALSCYTAALEIITLADNPDPWIKAQMGLGNAYRSRTQGPRIDNIERAIEHLNSGLSAALIYTPSESAAFQVSLGSAYAERIQEGRSENLEKALDYYEQAYKTVRWEDSPRDWALLQYNWANVYVHRVVGSPANNIEEAINHFQQAERVYTKDAFPYRWAGIRKALGDCYEKRFRDDKADNQEQAILYFHNALEVFTPDEHPVDWAGAKIGLGNVYSSRIEGAKEENLTAAIGYFTEALSVLSPEYYPEPWGTTQYNLGKVYGNRFEISGQTSDFDLAVYHLQLSLTIRSLDSFPVGYQHTQYVFGNLYFLVRNWNEAYHRYLEAIKAGNRLFAVSYTEEGQRYEIGEFSRIYAYATYCLLRQGRLTEALVLLEQGKTRLLTIALALCSVDVSKLPTSNREALLEAQKKIDVLQTEARLAAGTSGRRSESELREAQRQAYQMREDILATIRENMPDFMPAGLDLQSILALIPERGAFVAPLVTWHGSAVFVIPHGTEKLEKDQVLWIDDFTEKDLNMLLQGPSESMFLGSGWMGIYQIFRKNPLPMLETWQEIIDISGRKMWALLGPVHAVLTKLKIVHIILMPQGGLQLLPLHAAWQEVEGEQHYFLEDFESVRYAPSAYVLDVCERRAKQSAGKDALVIGINEYDRLPPLRNARAEAEAIAITLQSPPLLDSSASKDSIREAANGKAFLHFACHAAFAWDEDPLTSALYLAHDEPLSLSDIIGVMNLNTVRLVTLSACETGITDVHQSPDEYVGLPTGFLWAGAPAVISSLWTVDDLSTALLMVRFYDNYLERHMPPAVAFQEAQLWLRDATQQNIGEFYKSHVLKAEEAGAEYNEIMLSKNSAKDRLFEKPYTHPFYWAAFIYTGA